MPRKMTPNGFISRARLIVFSVVFGAFLLYIIGNYGKLAVDELKTAAPAVVETERGSILDADGKPLAVSTHFYHLAATPSILKKNISETARLIAPLLDMEPAAIEEMVTSASGDFLYIKKKLSESIHDELVNLIDSYNLRGLYFDTIPGRIYPDNALASHVIGYMGDSGVGLSGIEYTMQSVLSPEPVAQTEAVSVIQNRGQNVYLTIKSDLQYKLEKICHSALDSTQAESIMLIAAEAKTGEILSYISLPSANLNAYSSSSSEERTDRPAMHAYEPGSVFKIFSVSTFLELGGIKEDDIFLCDGRFEVSGAGGEKAVINCLDHHGWLTAREALKYSCNDVLAQMSQTVKTEDFLAKIREFGFGNKTGIELPSESRGLLKDQNDKYWSLRSQPTISIGQEMSVSALQMVQAALSIANGGVAPKLTLISKIVDMDGTVAYNHQVDYRDRVISEETAKYVLSCMETTAQSGTGSRANLGDVNIGVKTGTAQMADPVTGGYSDTDFVSNCMAVFPIEDPQIVLYIVITKAQGETYAGRIVAPVIAQAADSIIDHLGMQRNSASSITHSDRISFYTGKPAEINDLMPDLTGTPKRHLTQLLLREDLEILINGDGYVVSQYPPAGTPVTENMRIELNLE